MLYVKETIFCKRREIRVVENIIIQIELANNHKHILFEISYRLPESDANYFSNIENSLALELNIAISDIIVTRDFK